MTRSLAAAHVVISLLPPLPVLLVLLFLRAHRAKSYAEGGIVVRSEALAVAERHRRFVLHAQTIGIAVVACTGAWAVTGAGYFWPGGVLLGGLVTVALHARSAFAAPAEWS